MGVYPASYESPQNLIPDADAHAELSHHLAHAWSAAELSPFDRGLIVVMDGMGEAYGAMAKAEATLSLLEEQNRSAPGNAQQGVGDGTGKGSKIGTTPPIDSAAVEDDLLYYNDLRLVREMREGRGECLAEVEQEAGAGFQQVPEVLLPHESYREAESAYTFAPGPGVYQNRALGCTWLRDNVIKVGRTLINSGGGNWGSSLKDCKVWHTSEGSSRAKN